MATNTNYIKIKDERTGKNYAVAYFSEESKDQSLKDLQRRMDYDYFESLPYKERVNKKKHNLDFNCPNCLEKCEITSRKERITSGFLFFFSARLVDIFKCAKCNKEFFAEDLRNKMNRLERDNIILENFENWKQAKKEGRNPPEFYSIDKVDECIIAPL